MGSHRNEIKEGDPVTTVVGNFRSCKNGEMSVSRKSPHGVTSGRHSRFK